MNIPKDRPLRWRKAQDPPPPRRLKWSSVVPVLTGIGTIASLTISGAAFYYTRAENRPEVVVSGEFPQPIFGNSEQIGVVASIIISNRGGRTVTLLRMDFPEGLLQRLDGSSGDLSADVSFAEYAQTDYDSTGKGVGPRIWNFPFVINSPIEPGRSKVYALRVIVQSGSRKPLPDNSLILVAPKLTFNDGSEQRLAYLVFGRGTSAAADGAAPAPAPAPGPAPAPPGCSPAPTPPKC